MYEKAQIIGSNIKYLRKYAQITQKQLAEGIGTQAQISRIEKGEVIPLSTTLYEIAEKLGVDVNYFYDLAYTPRIDYVNEVKYQIRKAIRDRNYSEVDRIIKQEEQNRAFKNGSNLQFILWHKGITEYYIRQNIDNSLNILRSAFEIGKSNKKIAISAQDIEIINSMAIIYNEIKQYEQSIQTYLNALNHLKYIPDFSDPKVEIRIYYGLAKSLFKTEQYNESIKYCKKGMTLCIKEELLYLLGELHYESGQNYQALNIQEKALEHFSNAKLIFQIGNRREFVGSVKEKISKLS
ncbi:helix-turn-helix domain-containing protein [Bacillus sp. 1P10SD]|uniref:helix-turn-helix domain-containing protein n=1 Tax=Bacillus sp. 1P10SD TaxID=3132265 RepID=UPI0039A4C29E